MIDETRKKPMAEGTSSRPGDCRCHGGEVRGFLQPRILLALSQAPACGYDLLEGLRAGGLNAGEHDPDTGNLYRTLRCMEQEGWVQSAWDTSGTGPARRIYAITAQGMDLLDEWAVVLRRTRGWLDDFLDVYEILSQRRSYERV
jgi:poly-beta-hydroxybutyrate-responsive repressor